MSTENEKAFEQEAWHNINICCETLCDKSVVAAYIKQLEQENHELREILDRAVKY